MKVKVTIEEVISQTFEVEVSSVKNAHAEIREMYRNAQLVVDNPTLMETKFAIVGGESEWVMLD